jgi:GntR family transcriptional repressor for pyruvate dehydrogenase complex
MRQEEITGFRPIKQTKLFEEIIKAIRDQVVSGHLKPGDRLPAGRDLSDKLLVSRAVIREAMRILEFMGLVTIRPGEGTVLKDSHTPEMLADSLDAVLSDDEEMLIDLLEIRLLIEPPLARLAAEKAEGEDFDHLKATLGQMEAEISQGEIPVRGSMNFHYFLARMTHNTVAIRIMNILSGLSREFREASCTMPGRPQKSLSQHRSIFQAVSRKDTLGAETAMREHLDSVISDYREYMTQKRPKGET